MQCSLGISTCKLKVDRGIPIIDFDDKEPANIGDRKIKNIKTFESCLRSFPPPTCKPDIIMDWILCDENNTVEKKARLTDNAIVPCLFGGIIDFVDEGQRKYPKMEEILRDGFNLSDQE